MKNNYSIKKNPGVKFKQTKQVLFLMLAVLFFSGKALAQNFELVTVSSVSSGGNTNNALFVASSPTIPSLAFIRAQRIAGPEDGVFTINGDDIRYTSNSLTSGIPNNLSRIRFTFLQADGVTQIPVNDFRFVINDIDGPNNEGLATNCGANVRFNATADPTNLVIDNIPPDLNAVGSQNETAGPTSRVMYEFSDVAVIEFDNYANSGYLKDFDMDYDLAIVAPLYSVCLGDNDGDGITDDIDLDDDNDGILDVTEAGGNDPNGDHDGDGLPNYLDTSDDTGLSATYIANADGSVTNYTDADSNGEPDVYEASADADSDPNHLDSDSDNDGCPDVDEVYGAGTDSDGNGYYGAGIPAVDANGLVIAAGITGATYNILPSDNDINGTDDYLQTSIAVTGISTQPTDATITAINNATFNVVATTSGIGTAEQYQWQEDSGSGFVNITNGGVYSGATTATLTVSVLNSSLDGNSYRAIITTPSIVCDPEAQSNAVILTVTANLIEGVDDSGTVNEGILSVAVANVLVNDNLGGSTPTLANVTLSEISSTNPGITLNIATGEVNVAATTIEGVYSLVYQICETANISNCSTATVTITVNDAGNPVAADDTASTLENTLVTTGNVLTNDSVVDGATITSSDVTSANGGTVVNNGDGTFDYTPAAGFAGTDTFTYTLCDNDSPVASCSTATVTVTVTDAGNPIAVDDTASTLENTLVTTGNVLTNDSVVDGATITSSDVTSANGGTVVNNGDGTFDYTPAAGFAGTDTFTY
ncbi:Ig-like domain-containing protein, partial [Lutibacter oceani]